MNQDWSICHKHVTNRVAFRKKILYCSDMKKSIFKSLLIILLFTGFSLQINATEHGDKTHKSRFKTILYGLASFYNRSLQGFKTFNGEHYSGAKLTAAHKTLPMGTMVRVTDLRNHRSVVVRINDRLPQNSKRLIDLSQTAASKLHIISRGISQVSVEVLKQHSGTELASR